MRRPVGRTTTDCGGSGKQKTPKQRDPIQGDRGKCEVNRKETKNQASEVKTQL